MSKNDDTSNSTISDGGTKSAPMFLEQAQELLERLHKDNSEDVQTMIAEAMELAEEFRGWHSARPSSEIRLKTVQRLVELNRRAINYLDRKQRAVPPSRAQPSTGLLGRLFKR